MSDMPISDDQPVSPPVLLFVDDEANILSALRRLFRPHGYKIHVAEGGAQGLALLEREPVDLVISDMRMPGMDGAQFLEQVRAKWPDTVRILLTGYADVSSTIAAINKGEIYRYIAKPWNDDELVSSIAQALAYRDLTLENLHLADKARVDSGAMSAQELERKRLEEQEPGITQVNWGPDGSVILDFGEE